MNGQALWLDYRFLTREMAAFIARQELDMFYELQNQREQLQLMIEQQGSNEYLHTEDGQEMVQEIEAEEKLICMHLRGTMNRLQQQRQVRRAYHAPNSGPVGGRTDFSG